MNIQKTFMLVSIMSLICASVFSQTTKVEDLFDGANGSAADAAIWPYPWGSPTHTGAGQLSIPAGGGPFAEGVGSYEATIVGLNNITAAEMDDETVTMETWMTVPANSFMYTGRTDMGSWGNNQVVVTWGPGTSGNLELDSWFDATAPEDSGIAYPADASFGVRQSLTTPSGGAQAVVNYYYNFGAGWVEYVPTDNTYSTANVTNYFMAFMNASASNVCLLDEHRILIGVAATPTPTPTPGPTPDRWNEYTTVFEDHFDGSAGAVPDAAKWYVGGSNSVTQDGSSVLHMVTGQTNWNPYIDTRSGLFSISGDTWVQVEMSIKTIAGLQVFGFGPSAGDGNGRCFIPQPTGNDTSPFALSVGANTWSASVATDGPYVVNPNDQFVKYRVELDPSTDPGTVRYYVYDTGTSAWVDVSPTGDAITEYDKSLDWMPWVMCSGWNGGDGPGADLYVDYVKVQTIVEVPVELSFFTLE